MKLKTNEKKLVEFLLEVTPGQPVVRTTYQVDTEGKPFLLPGIGGITLNVAVGDSVFGLIGDHIEPDVSAAANPLKRMDHPNSSVQMLANIGDEAVILSGAAKGAKGYVFGHHGGSEHLIIHFSESVKRKMTYDDKIQIKSKGMGLKLTDHPYIHCFNLNPRLIHKMGLVVKDNILNVPVTVITPPELMGSGIGASNVASGDYDIMTADISSVKKHGIDKLKFGDFVAIIDHDNRYGRGYKKGYISIGIVVHSDCMKAGHGPGVATIFSGPAELLKPIIKKDANIKNYL